MKKILIGVLALAIAGGSAFAQTSVGPGNWVEFGVTQVDPNDPDSAVIPAPVGFVQTAHDWTTFGNITYHWNNIMSPAWHSGVQLDNWLGFASFAATNQYAMAYATRIAGIYIAAYAGGTGFGNFMNRDFTRMSLDTWGGTGWREFRLYGPQVVGEPGEGGERGAQAGFPNPNVGNNNRVSLLVGVADMGFRLSYATTVSRFNVSEYSRLWIDNWVNQAGDPDNDPPDYVDLGGLAYFSEISSVFGMRQIALGWGMSRNLDPVRGIRPNAEVRLNFARNMLQANPLGADGVAQGNFINHSANYVQPEIELSSGWVNFVTTDSGWQIRGDLLYVLGFRMFNNDFSEWEGATIRNINISGTRTSEGYFERSWMNHRIRPRVQLHWAGERINLSTRLVLDNFITTSEENMRTLDNFSVSSNNGSNTSIFEYTFQPSLELAMRWFAIPDRFTLLAGGRYWFGDITRTVTEVTQLGADGSAVPQGTTTQTELEFANAVAQLRVGATFHFNQNFAIDASTGVANAGLNNTLNIFGSGANNLFTFGRIVGVLTF